mgnify:FL=1
MGFLTGKTSFRSSLNRLIAIAVLPTVLMMASAGVVAYQMAIQHSRDALREVANATAAHYNQQLSHAADKLSILGRLSSVQGSDASACTSDLMRLASLDEQTGSVFKVDRTGQVLCANIPLFKPMNFAALDGFEAAWASSDTQIMSF